MSTIIAFLLLAGIATLVTVLIVKKDKPLPPYNGGGGGDNPKPDQKPIQ
jgi:hypothetical protein